MPKDKTSKAVRYAEYKRLEEARLFDGVKKLISFMNLLCKRTNMSKSQVSITTAQMILQLIVTIIRDIEVIQPSVI